jgi:hypothetical protein
MDKTRYSHVDVLLHEGVVGPLVFGDSNCFVCGSVGLWRKVEFLLGCDTFVMTYGNHLHVKIWHWRHCQVQICCHHWGVLLHWA